MMIKAIKKWNSNISKRLKKWKIYICSQPLKKYKHSDDECSWVEEITELKGQSQPNLPKTPIDSEKQKKKLAEGEIPIPRDAFTINPQPKNDGQIVYQKPQIVLPTEEWPMNKSKKWKEKASKQKRCKYNGWMIKNFSKNFPVDEMNKVVTRLLCIEIFHHNMFHSFLANPDVNDNIKIWTEFFTGTFKQDHTDFLIA